MNLEIIPNELMRPHDIKYREKQLAHWNQAMKPPSGSGSSCSEVSSVASIIGIWISILFSESEDGMQASSLLGIGAWAAILHSHTAVPAMYQ
jgi:hypothetical protein